MECDFMTAESGPKACFLPVAQPRVIGKLGLMRGWPGIPEF